MSIKVPVAAVIAFILGVSGGKPKSTGRGSARSERIKRIRRAVAILRARRRPYGRRLSGGGGATRHR